ncbi:MAG: sulfatase [Spirosomataceae bacterium]
MKPFTRLLLLGIACFLVSASSTQLPPKPPNVVLIFCDDLGYGDLSCYGAVDYHTPTLDKMAAEGIRFTNFLVAQAVCSASRAALLTGCYPNRVGISGALMPWAEVGINPAEETLAELLKTKGYKTGIFGKWHLGHHPQFLPLQHGFDEYLGLPYSNDMWPVDFDGKPITDPNSFKSKYPILPLIENNQKIKEIRTLDDQATLTTTYTERAVQFIQKHKNEPFFLYVPHSMPHVPLGVSSKFKGKSAQGMYGDVIEEIDWSVSQILKTLKDNQLDRNTLVIFTSDNGPWINFGNHAGSTGGFRQGKGTSYEGGHRVPCIVRWKGVVPEGLVCNQLATTLDLLPTITKLCGASQPTKPIDGVDIFPLFQGKFEVSPRKEFYYYYQRNHLEAVRRDNWKLVLPHVSYQSYEGMLPGQDGFPGPYRTDTIKMALYDLRRDPGERYDVQSQYPTMVAKLLLMAERAREDLGDDITKRIGKNNRPSGMINR